MPVMSMIEGAFCRSGPWRSFARGRVLPWVLDGFELRGDVLEIGGGSGAMAEGVARSFPAAHLTVTDVDRAMVAAAKRRLGQHRAVQVQHADVTALPYPVGTFDVVTSYLMLHHVIDWMAALSEAARVLRPGGTFIGYDLTDTKLARIIHRLDGSPHKLIAPGELREGLKGVGFDGVEVDVSAREHLMRFRATRRGA